MYTIRDAGLSDLDFICEVIINAEKSMSEILGIANIFEITEEELREYLASMLSEEIDGCEYSLSSFIIACYNEDTIGALGGWLEGYPEGISSSMLKANLIGATFPKEKVIRAQQNFEVIKPLQYERDSGAYQIEYAYMHKNHRGIGIPQELMEKHIERAKELNPNVKKVQVQPYENNKTMIKVHENSGFKVIKRYVSNSPEVLNFVPFHSKVLMEKKI